MGQDKTGSGGKVNPVRHNVEEGRRDPGHNGEDACEVAHGRQMASGPRRNFTQIPHHAIGKRTASTNQDWRPECPTQLQLKWAETHKKHYRAIMETCRVVEIICISARASLLKKGLPLERIKK